jgi:hypothetical protein
VEENKDYNAKEMFKVFENCKKYTKNVLESAVEELF